jgi:hypothetical protein
MIIIFGLVIQQSGNAEHKPYQTRRPLGVNLGSVDRASSGKYAKIV